MNINTEFYDLSERYRLFFGWFSTSKYSKTSPNMVKINIDVLCILVIATLV